MSKLLIIMVLTGCTMTDVRNGFVIATPIIQTIGVTVSTNLIKNDQSAVIFPLFNIKI